jgi:threonine synthase
MTAPNTSALGTPFVSTRSANAPTAIDETSIDQALLAGLAPDGGLYVPQTIPQLDANTITARIGTSTLADTATAVLAPYFVDSRLRDLLPALCARAYDFDAPLVPMRGAQDYVLELFHGPTAAFKDYAARFLAECLAALGQTSSTPANITTILVATSGDTGAAVAGAFHRRPGFAVTILYPHGRESGAVRCRIAPYARTDLCEQHQPRSFTAAGRVLRAHRRRIFRCAWARAESDDSHRQSRQCRRRVAR